MFSQGKRSDIIRELALLENPNADISTLTPLESKLDSGKSVGEEYGLCKASVIRLIRIDKLIPSLKKLVDSGEIALRGGVELSFLSEKSQAVVAEQAEDFKIDMKKAKALHDAADKNGNIDSALIVRILTGTVDVKAKPKSVKISDDVYSRYFTADMKKKEVTETIEKALQFYFGNFSKDDHSEKCTG